MSWKSFFACAPARARARRRPRSRAGVERVRPVGPPSPDTVRATCVHRAGRLAGRGRAAGAPAHPRHVPHVHAVGLDADQLVHHGLEGPLQQQRRDRVVAAVQEQHDRRCVAAPRAKVEQLALLDARQVRQRLRELLAHLRAPLVPGCRPRWRQRPEARSKSPAGCTTASCAHRRGKSLQKEFWGARICTDGRETHAPDGEAPAQGQDQ